MGKQKLLNLALILSSLIVYLEWGGDNSMFLFEGEIEFFSKIFQDPLSILHPFIILPLCGQIILAITLFQKQPSKILTYVGLGGLSILILFISFIGLLDLNFKIVLSTIPFILSGILAIRNQRKRVI